MEDSIEDDSFSRNSFYLDKGLKKLIIEIMLNDNEFLMAINSNDISRISARYFNDLFRKFDKYFKHEKNLREYVYNIFQELVGQKLYYELLPSKKELKPFSWGIGLHSYKWTYARINMYDSYYSIANYYILKSETLVRCINQGQNSFLEEYIDFVYELNEVDRHDTLPLILYVYDILVKSKIYFIPGEEISQELIGDLVAKFPYNEKVYVDLVERYIEGPKKILKLN